MKKILYISIISLFSLSTFAQKHVDVYSFNDLQNVLDKKNDTVYVVNFWATWCKPCVKELPFFEKINAEYTGQVKVILVSLDFADQINSDVIPFLEQRDIRSEVILLDESNPNDYIDKINPKWSGAIPATLVYNKNGSDFYEQSFDYEGLISIVERKLYEE